MSDSPQKSIIERRQSAASLSSYDVSQHRGKSSQHEEKPNLNVELKLNSSVAPGSSNLSGSNFTTPSNQGTIPSSASGVKGVTGPSVINKQLLSKLNKSLKEKQKITSARESQAKNPTLIQNVLSTSPNIPGSLSSSAIDHNNTIGSTQHDDHSKIETKDPDLLSVTSSAQNQGKETGVKSKVKEKNKKISKQNSTRTDFFAAKLASAVDDVESSDSDETFVYETNAQEFSNEDEVVPPANSAGNNLALLLVKATEPSTQGENINYAPSSIHIVNDNISISGSVRNIPCEARSGSPLGEQKKDDDRDLSPYVPSLLASGTESIHSLQSSKPFSRNTIQVTLPTATNGRANLSNGAMLQNESSTFPDPYMDSHVRHQRQATRKSSCHSIYSDDKKDHLVRTPQTLHGTSKQNVNSVPYGVPETSHSLARPFQDGLYAYERDEDISGDEASSHGEVNLVSTENNMPIPASGNKGDLSQVGYKSKSNKPSTTSSKLRSTTSKLFDKKGAQPRRYSTIPDDIDIEDFDDELIYYDNRNIRFPHHNNNASMNENSSLLNGHKLPHHRSLNLNFSGKRAAANPRNTRYVSLGYAPPVSYQNGNKKTDIFPFPYPDGSHQSFYGFDEYEEEAQMQPDNGVSSKLFQDRAPFSLGNTRFLLHKKVSQDLGADDRLKVVKSIIYTIIGIICILSVGFISGFLLASTKDLTNVLILSIDHATVSEDELVFNVVIEALNPGWLTVPLKDLELDVFAKSGYLGDDSATASVETVLLGTVLNFESTIFFEGSFFNREATQNTGEIKLIGPGRNLTGSQIMTNSLLGTNLQNTEKEPNEPHAPQDNAEKWAIVSKHPFDLILRGVIKYNLPWASNIKSVVVNKVGYIDPSQTL